MHPTLTAVYLIWKHWFWICLNLTGHKELWNRPSKILRVHKRTKPLLWIPFALRTNWNTLFFKIAMKSSLSWISLRKYWQQDQTRYQSVTSGLTGSWLMRLRARVLAKQCDLGRAFEPFLLKIQFQTVSRLCLPPQYKYLSLANHTDLTWEFLWH